MPPRERKHEEIAENLSPPNPDPKAHLKPEETLVSVPETRSKLDCDKVAVWTVTGSYDGNRYEVARCTQHLLKHLEDPELYVESIARLPETLEAETPEAEI